MPKILSRLAALLLIPCLMQEPTTLLASSLFENNFGSSPQPAWFQTNAFALPAEAFTTPSIESSHHGIGWGALSTPAVINSEALKLGGMITGIFLDLMSPDRLESAFQKGKDLFVKLRDKPDELNFVISALQGHTVQPGITAPALQTTTDLIRSAKDHLPPTSLGKPTLRQRSNWPSLKSFFIIAVVAGIAGSVMFLLAPKVMLVIVLVLVGGLAHISSRHVKESGPASELLSALRERLVLPLRHEHETLLMAFFGKPSTKQIHAIEILQKLGIASLPPIVFDHLVSTDPRGEDLKLHAYRQTILLPASRQKLLSLWLKKSLPIKNAQRQIAGPFKDNPESLDDLVLGMLVAEHRVADIQAIANSYTVWLKKESAPIHLSKEEKEARAAKQKKAAWPIRAWTDLPLEAAQDLLADYMPHEMTQDFLYTDAILGDALLRWIIGAEFEHQMGLAWTAVILERSVEIIVKNRILKKAMKQLPGWDRVGSMKKKIAGQYFESALAHIFTANRGLLGDGFAEAERFAREIYSLKYGEGQKRVPSLSKVIRSLVKRKRYSREKPLSRTDQDQLVRSFVHQWEQKRIVTESPSHAMRTPLRKAA